MQSLIIITILLFFETLWHSPLRISDKKILFFIIYGQISFKLDQSQVCSWIRLEVIQGTRQLTKSTEICPFSSRHLCLHIGLSLQRIELATPGWAWIKAFSHGFMPNTKNGNRNWSLMVYNDKKSKTRGLRKCSEFSTYFLFMLNS